ncbi:MAG: hypothetical protein BWY19_00697 [bacterium ADurb.Bin212]|nr:MAG: hypothetical protein BWY19_00697 [bacterium ADurb.Bin212]
MPIVGKYFPSQKTQEKVFLLLRRHWFTYFGFVAVAVIMSIPLLAVIIVWINRPDYFSATMGNIAIILVFAYVLFALAIMLYGFIDYYLDVYIVTNERIVNVEQNGFFRRKISELHLHQIQDVSAKVDGMFSTMLHYGNVYIQTAGERENFIFQSIPNPYRVSKLIVDLHEAQIQERFEDTLKSAENNMINKDRQNSQSNRDNLDMEMANPKLLSEVRSQTKKFLSEEGNEDSDIYDELNSNVAETQSTELLNNIDNDTSNHKDIKADEETRKKVEKKSPPKGQKDSRKNATSKQKGKTEGEMKENVEIDF